MNENDLRNLLTQLHARLGSAHSLDAEDRRLLTTVLHVGAIGLLALRLPSPPALRAALVPVLAWILPGLAGAGQGAPGTLRNLVHKGGFGKEQVSAAC